MNPGKTIRDIAVTRLENLIPIITLTVAYYVDILACFCVAVHHAR